MYMYTHAHAHAHVHVCYICSCGINSDVVQNFNKYIYCYACRKLCNTLLRCMCMQPGWPALYLRDAQ